MLDCDYELLEELNEVMRLHLEIARDTVGRDVVYYSVLFSMFLNRMNNLMIAARINWMLASKHRLESPKGKGID